MTPDFPAWLWLLLFLLTMVLKGFAEYVGEDLYELLFHRSEDAP